MDTKVREIGERVVAALEADGHAKLTIVQYRNAIRWLEILAQDRGEEYSPALGADFAVMTADPRTGKVFSPRPRADFARLAGVFDSYVFTGQVDLSAKRHGGGRVVPQSKDFTVLLAAWSAEMEQRGLAVATQSAYSRAACDYLLYLEANGIMSLQEADGASVFGFLESLSDRWAKTALWSAVTSFRPFLNFTQRVDLLNALKMAGVKRHHGIVPLLGNDEEEIVVQACMNGQVSARDAAITLLALVTGLRACDLVSLRLQDIDWRGRTVGIVQQKTSNPLTMPLPPAIAGKLAEYVLGERPNVVDEHVFLRVVAPHTELAGHAAIYRVTARVFKTAGLERTRVGTRLLRHNAASKLLRAGTPLPTISAVLGHSSPDSTDVYLSTDTEHMRACVLPLPIRQGVIR
ncbi:tyrosine-type recombinase/integrase [Pseudarthrobacter sp. S3]|uniref:tyrosine-type recombinase/integrase n=1 Tax=Pseudarthrobacter sp. S3 TaxID=3418419 RepID=UPI003CFB65D6